MPGVIGATGNKLGGVLAAGALNILSQQANYAVNTRTRLMIPEAGALFNLVAHSHASWQDVWDQLAMHGIDYNYGSWQAVYKSLLSYPTTNEAMQAYYRGATTTPQMNKWIEHNGFNGTAEFNWLFNKPHVWTPGEARILYNLGKLTQAKYQDYLKTAGLVRQDDRTNWNWLQKGMTSDQAYKAWHRNILDDTELDSMISLEGFSDSWIKDAMKKMSYELPTPSDLVGFAVKEVWNRDIVQRFGYDDEFDNIPEFRYWMNRLGMSGDPNIPGSQPGGPANWAQAHWRQHWRNVAPGQAFAMLHRFRPTGGPNGTARVPYVPGTTDPVGAFTIQDVQAVLKVNDYPPFWRNKLAALSYNVLRLVDIRRIARLSLADPVFKQNAIGSGFSIFNWCKENYMDRGQTAQDAQSLATFTMYEAEQANSKETRLIDRQLNARKKKLYEAQYRIGVISAPDALTKFTAVGYDTAQAAELLSIIDEERKLRCTMDLMNSVKGPLMKGKINDADARTRLTAAGLMQTFVGFWVDCWKGLLTEDAARETTNEIIAEFENGTIDKATAISRLEQLGWDEAEALLLALAA